MSALRGERESHGAARSRIRAAVRSLVLAEGCDGLTMEKIAERAGLAEEELQRHCGSPEECLLDTYLSFTLEFDRQVFAAFEDGDGWRPALRAAAYAAARFIEENPREMRFAAIGLLEGGPMIQAHRARHLQRLADLIDRGRQELDDPTSLGRSVAEAAIGSINALLVKELQSSCEKRAADYVPEMMYVAVRPYLGHEAAREELTLPRPAGSEDPE